MRSVEVCLAVVRHGDRVLVQRRREDGPLRGVWEFPGGKRLPGERGRTCARREALEETGMDVRVVAEVHRTRWTYSDRRVLLRFFLSVARDAACRGPSPAASRRWVTVEELRLLPVPAANAAFIETLAIDAPNAASGNPPGTGGTSPRRARS